MIKRYLADSDSVITNAYLPNLTNRATGSNQGECDTLQIFSIYAQASTGSSELSRVLIHFPISQISSDRASSKIPQSGSCDFILRCFNAPHSFTTPKKYTLEIAPLSRSFDEGFGMDSDEYSDIGTCNWINASSASVGGVSAWSSQGGDYFTSSYTPSSNLPSYTKYFDTGFEDLELNITSLVEELLAGTEDNHGLIIKLTSSIETAPSSSYVKKFFARGSEYFFKRPIIETQWNDAKIDNRNNFYASSSFQSSTENTNNLYFYNYYKGQLRNVPGYVNGGNSFIVKLYSGSADVTPSSMGLGKWVETGIYSASFVLTSSVASFHDVWHNIASVGLFTGSEVTVNSQTFNSYNPSGKYIANISNLKSVYKNNETPRMRIFTRDSNWSPQIYSKAYSSNIQIDNVDNLFYQVKRIADDLTVVEYGTGSIAYTKCSQDASGSYFNFDMSLLEPNYMYEIALKYAVEEDEYTEIENKFRFRVES